MIASTSATLTWIVVGVMSYTAPAQVAPRDCGKSISGRVYIRDALGRGDWHDASARVTCTKK